MVTMCSGIPTAELLIVNNAGHLVQHSRPEIVGPVALLPFHATATRNNPAHCVARRASWLRFESAALSAIESFTSAPDCWTPGSARRYRGPVTLGATGRAEAAMARRSAATAG